MNALTVGKFSYVLGKLDNKEKIKKNRYDGKVNIFQRYSFCLNFFQTIYTEIHVRHVEFQCKLIL